MSLKGNLSSINLAEIIQLIGLGEKSGCLRIQSKNDSAYVFFHEGLLTYAYTKSAPINLSKMLLAKNLIPKDKVEQLFQYSKEKTMNPLDIIVKGKLMSKEMLQSLIKNTILNHVYGLFKWEEGEFEFEDNKKPKDAIMLINSNFNNVIMEGSRRVDEIDLIKKTIPSDKTPLMLSVNGIKKLQEMKIEDFEKKMISRFNGITDIYHISLLIEEIDEFDLYKHVYGFVQSKIIEALTESSYNTIKDHIDLATFLIERENYEEALREASRALLLAPFFPRILWYLYCMIQYLLTLMGILNIQRSFVQVFFVSMIISIKIP